MGKEDKLAIGIHNLSIFSQSGYADLRRMQLAPKDAALICGLNTLAKFQDKVDFSTFSVNIEYDRDGDPYVYAIRPATAEQSAGLQTFLQSVKESGLEVPVPFQFPSNWSADTDYGKCNAITENLKNRMPFLARVSDELPIITSQSGLNNRILGGRFTPEEQKEIRLLCTPNMQGERFKIRQIIIPQTTEPLRAKAVAIAKDLGHNFPNPPDSTEPLDIHGKDLENLSKLAMQSQFGPKRD